MTFWVRAILYMLGHWLVQKGLDIEFGATANWQDQVGGRLQQLGSLLVHWSGWPMNNNDVAGQ